MNNDYESRSGYRAKRKKTNLILNSLIVIVIVLIVFVAIKIFASGGDSASPKKDVQHTAEKQTEQKKDQTEAAKETSTTTENDTGSSDTSTDGTTVENQQSGDTSTDGSDDSQTEATDDGSTTNDEKTTENKDGKPVGTTQTGEHTPVYDTSSKDWQEMLNAISSATGLDQSNMIVWHLGRDQSKQNASVGTVSSKDKKQNYTVYIEWVDGQGWKPTKVETN
ncbi:YrrS family protein [Neobacillus niacini]|uniref:YrrS family protein n=1 Tax=Neobacillus niacini TaxID=86668 RepID=UPI0028587992|nr:YrrS family protein [Neobacillus niacini]MDR7000366.1 cytoskeletal protein RodZ [Neobacillus niacini]